MNKNRFIMQLVFVLNEHLRICVWSSPGAAPVQSLGSLGCQSAVFGIPAHNSRVPSCADPQHWGQHWTQSSSPLCTPLETQRTTLSFSFRTVPWRATKEAPSLYPETKETLQSWNLLIYTKIIVVGLGIIELHVSHLIVILLHILFWYSTK